MTCDERFGVVMFMFLLQDHSESDDTLEKPHYPEKPRMQPKEQQPVIAAVKQHPHRNKVKVNENSFQSLQFLYNHHV